jgi:subtilase family serine protease
VDKIACFSQSFHFFERNDVLPASCRKEAAKGRGDKTLTCFSHLAKTAMKTNCLPRALTAFGGLLLFIATPVALAAQTQGLHGHVPAIVKSLPSLGRFPGTNHLSLAIGLPLRNQAALSNLLRQIYDPASPNYHHYLTPEQFTERFGPTEADYQAVIAFAGANGLQITGTHPNRVLLDVSGSVTDVERALHVTMQAFRHPTENRTFYAPDTEPSLDLGVPVLHISGLDNYSLPHPRLVAKPLVEGQNASPSSGSGPNGNYMGGDFRAAYVPDTTLTGSGQIVGLLQFDGYTASDITYYESLAGLPNVTLQNVLLDGFSGTPTGSGGEVEVSLDIEMAISMATNLSKVIVYEAGPYGNWHDILNRMATDNLAKQLSCSWYSPGAGSDAVADVIFQQMAAQGQSFFNASGDDDAWTGLIPFPGDTPYITQVGGTTLTTSGPGGSWSSETVWNWGGGIGSGGGISTQYPIPAWQTNISMTANQGSTTKRNTPDVALTADTVYVRADGRNYSVGGTSCAAPLWAGFAALVNQQATAASRPAIGFINPAVDAIGTGANYTSVFHDITTGNNTWSGSPTKFYAVGGYDLCTG